MNADSVTIPQVTPATDAEEERFESFADRLLRPDRERDAWSEDGRRLATGLGLAATFGATLGLRSGGAALLMHAAGVTAGVLTVPAVAVPAFAIVLALADVPVDAQALGRATSRAVAKAGLVLAGLAPAAALYVVTVEDAITVTCVGFGALVLAGALAARSFDMDLRGPLAAAPARAQTVMVVAMPAFLAFTATLALRVWWLTLPILAAGTR